MPWQKCVLWHWNLKKPPTSKARMCTDKPNRPSLRRESRVLCCRQRTPPRPRQSQAEAPQGPADEIIIYASDLAEEDLSELEIWDDPASPGGKMIGITNTGDELDAPPENDPPASFE